MNTFIGSTNFHILQHQMEGGTNPLIYKNQPERSYNSVIYLAITGRRHQPPLFTGTDLKEAPTP
jgi:hypothetical protein